MGNLTISDQTLPKTALDNPKPRWARDYSWRIMHAAVMTTIWADTGTKFANR